MGSIYPLPKKGSKVGNRLVTGSVYWDHASQAKVELTCTGCGKTSVFRITPERNRNCYCLSNKDKNLTHGDSRKDSRSRLYIIWSSMLTRCYVEGLDNQAWYYDKDIEVYAPWHNYTEFKTWALSSGYEDTLQLDRIDSNKDYCPSNCQWLSKSENVRRAAMKGAG